MQARLLQMMEDHTHALVAVSHDLRTPIQRIRLRSGLLRDEEMHRAMALDLADMDWDRVADRIAQSWELVAPRRLLEAGGR